VPPLANPDYPSQPTRDQALAMFRAGLDKAMRDTAAQYSIPICWIHAENGNPHIADNGTAFLLDCGAGPFLVTAGHVYQGYLDAKAAHADTVCFLSALKIDLEGRLIGNDQAFDVVTLRISQDEVAQLAKLGKFVLTGSQSSWPPAAPTADRGVFFVGFPGDGRTLLPYRGGNLVEIDWNGYAALAVATAVNETSITLYFERDSEYNIVSRPVAPPEWALGGCSGAPLLNFIEMRGVYSWQLGGVVTEASGNILHAARASCIEPDGHVRSHPDLMAYKPRQY